MGRGVVVLGGINTARRGLNDGEGRLRKEELNNEGGGRETWSGTR